MKNQEIKSGMTPSIRGRLPNYQKQFECPINMALMQNPTMITVCGHTFDKDAIERCLLSKKQCPVCRKKATLSQLCCNFSLKNIIDTYKQNVKLIANADKKDVAYNIKKAIDQYYDKIQIEIKQLIKTKKTDPNVPGLIYKLKKQMKNKEIYQIAKQLFKIFKIQIDKNTLEIIKHAQNIKLIQGNYSISWHYKQSSFLFGEQKLNSSNQMQLDGYGFRMIVGQSIFKGQFLNGKPNGNGNACYNDGQTYSGDWKDGKIHGKGKYCWTYGQTYQGEYKDGNKHGTGKFCWANGSTYQGDLKNDKKHGTGKCCYADGSTYQGDWKDGKKHGTGKCCYANGSAYQGEYKDGNKHGKGKYCWVNGSTYQGDWKDDKKHGTGKCCYANGQTYQGEYMDDKKHGKGKYIYANRSTYQGDFKDDKFNGKGKYSYNDGSTYQGDWKDDKRHGTGIFFQADGKIYYGDWKNSLKHGKGTYCYVDGSYYQGDWKDDKIHVGIKYLMQIRKLVFWIQVFFQYKNFLNLPDFLQVQFFNIEKSYLTSQCYFQTQNKKSIFRQNVIFYYFALKSIGH